MSVTKSWIECVLVSFCGWRRLERPAGRERARHSAGEYSVFGAWRA
jgi:hypothetical protein